MIVQKTKRYRKDRNKLNANDTRKINSKIIDGSEVVKMKEWTNFNIRPGMMTWQGMPEDYKRAYHEQQEAIEKRRFKEKRATAQDFQNRADRANREKALNKRVKEMEKRLESKADEYIDTKKKKKGSGVSLDNAVCNFIDKKFFEARAKIVKRSPTKNRKRILLISDVCGWAWWNKSRYIQMYLKDQFDIDVICVLGPEAQGINRGKYDLYLTYGYSYVGMLQQVNIKKRITGITAHRPIGTIKSFMTLAHNLHANSMMLFNELKKVANHNRVWYVPNGVDEHVFRPIKPIGQKKQLIAGHVGKKCEAKGQEQFIIPAMQAADVESVTNMNDYRNRSPYCEMYEYYQNMDVFLVASVEDGTPNGALEAAACGRPIISNPIGNMPEFIENGVNGFLVGRNVDEYIEKLNYLNKNRKVLEKMGKAARKTVEKSWTWKKQSEGYRRMFSDILEKG
jgi:glycosyltransferase involved in cell wall biosynthesis